MGYLIYYKAKKKELCEKNEPQQFIKFFIKNIKNNLNANNRMRFVFKWSKSGNN